MIAQIERRTSRLPGFFEASVLGMVLASHFNAIVPFVVAGHIDLSVQFLTLAVIALGMYSRLLLAAVKPNAATTRFSVFFFIFLLWVMIEGTLSSQGVRAFTLIIIAMCDLFMVWAVSVSGSGKSLRKLNGWVFALGVVTAGIGLMFFLYALTDYRGMMRHYRENDVKFIYEVAHGSVPQFEGFTGDPNSFGMFYVISFYCGAFLTGLKGWQKRLKWIGMTVMAASLLLTVSRGFYLAFLLTPIVFIFWKAAIPGLRMKLPIMKPVLIMLALSSVVFLVTYWAFDLSYTSFITERVERGSARRLNYQNDALAVAQERLFFGHGLRASQSLQSDRGYIENSYLSLLFDLGIVGLGLYLMLILMVGFRGAARVRMDRYTIPWLMTWILLAIQGMYIFTAYSLFLWMVAGVLLASPPQTQGAKESHQGTSKDIPPVTARLTAKTIKTSAYS